MTSTRLPLKLLDEKFAVCRMDAKERAPAWVLDMPAQVVALMRTPTEMCIVCDEADVPRTATAVDRGFRAFRLDGPIPHGVTGILSSLTKPLADAGISVFSLFTYDTNYLFVKEADVGRASTANPAPAQSRLPNSAQHTPLFDRWMAIRSCSCSAST
jgi:hypothetical protein